MKIFIILILIILLISVPIYCIMINKENKYTLIIGPSDYYYITKINKYYNMYKLYINLLKELNINTKINNNLLYKIRKIYNKPIIYCIKKKNDVYRSELYFYHKLLLPYNSPNSENIKISKKNMINIINLIKNNDYIETINNIYKLFDSIHLFSIDIDNIDKIDIYTLVNIGLEQNNKKMIVYHPGAVSYDLITNNVLIKTVYFSYSTYKDLQESLLKEFGKKFETNINNILKDMNEIAINPKRIIYHYKFNKIGIYLLGVNYDSFTFFIKKYNYLNAFNDEVYKYLTYDIVINYDIINFTLTETGYSNYF